MGVFSGSTGDWCEYTSDQVKAVIFDLADGATLDEPRTAGDAAREVWQRERSEAISIMTAAGVVDPVIEGLIEEAQSISDLSIGAARKALVGSIGSVMTRDTTALSQGFSAAPHQDVQAEVIAIESVFRACKDLADIADRAAAHLGRVEKARVAVGQGALPRGNRVFIGHGASPAWLELKSFISDRLQLEWDEFNRVPVAGVTNIARLSEMLDEATIAFLICTAEDETSIGEVRARQNVVHEAGLFQGRLGFGRAIVLLEEGCEEFSNIAGLGQIRFPAGSISSAFEEVRKVLEREGMIEQPATASNAAP